MVGMLLGEVTTSFTTDIKYHPLAPKLYKFGKDTLVLKGSVVITIS